MSMSKIHSVALTAAMFAVLPATATEAWQPAPGEAGVSFPAHAQGTLTRQQFLAQWAEERRSMAARGYKYDLLYGTYVFVGPGSPPSATTAMTREQFLENEAEQDRQMRAKGLKWNQLFGAYQSAR